MLQHLWAGPTSNASVDIVQGRYYVEVHSVGVTKGSAMERILGEIVLQNKSITTPIDYVLCIVNQENQEGVIDRCCVKGEAYFSVAIGNTHTKASYFLDSSNDVVQLIHRLCTQRN
ncbi:hypothetical protein Bca4012_027253 [Brassica carinata]